MPKYQNGKIYRIVDNTCDQQYIGSTTLKLAQRLAQHVQDHKKWQNGEKNYYTSFKIIGNSDYDIILIENCPCDSKEELIKRERHFIETTECVNKVIPGRSKQESDHAYYEDNKDIIKGKQLLYREENKQRITETEKKYRENNKSKIADSNKLYRKKKCRTDSRKGQKTKIC